MSSRNQGKSRNSSLLRMDFPTYFSWIYSISTKEEILYIWTNILLHIYKGQYHSGLNGSDSIICINFYHLSLLSHLHTMTCSHGHQPCWLWAQEIEMADIDMPSGTFISGSIHITIQMEVLIDNLKRLGSDHHWCFCNIFFTQGHAVAAIACDEYTAMFFCKCEIL